MLIFFPGNLLVFLTEAFNLGFLVILGLETFPGLYSSFSCEGQDPTVNSRMWVRS